MQTDKFVIHLGTPNEKVMSWLEKHLGKSADVRRCKADSTGTLYVQHAKQGFGIDANGALYGAMDHFKSHGVAYIVKDNRDNSLWLFNPELGNKGEIYMTTHYDMNPYKILIPVRDALDSEALKKAVRYQNWIDERMVRYKPSSKEYA